MKEIYLLDIVATEGRKEIHTTKVYKSKKELLNAYEVITDLIDNKNYTHSKGIITVTPKIILAKKIIYKCKA